MSRALVIIATVAFVVAIVCFGAAGLVGGPWGHGGHFWGRGSPWAPWGQHWTPGPTIERNYQWAGGDTLRIDVPASLAYTQGPTSKLTITGPKGLLDRLTVENGRIGIDGWIDDAPTLKIVMTAPNVTDFEVSGAQILSIANYKQDQLTIGVSGAGNVMAKGEAAHTTLRISGSGNGDLGGLTGDDSTVRISGAGRATIAPKLSADVNISGVGQVTLLTHPATVNQRISGAGSVIQASAK
jgi:hypothetical protein